MNSDGLYPHGYLEDVSGIETQAKPTNPYKRSKARSALRVLAYTCIAGFGVFVAKETAEAIDQPKSYTEVCRSIGSLTVDDPTTLGRVARSLSSSNPKLDWRSARTAVQTLNAQDINALLPEGTVITIPTDCS